MYSHFLELGENINGKALETTSEFLKPKDLAFAHKIQITVKLQYVEK